MIRSTYSERALLKRLGAYAEQAAYAPRSEKFALCVDDHPAPIVLKPTPGQLGMRCADAGARFQGIGHELP